MQSRRPSRAISRRTSTICRRPLCMYLFASSPAGSWQPRARVRSRPRPRDRTRVALPRWKRATPPRPASSTNTHSATAPRSSPATGMPRAGSPSAPRSAWRASARRCRCRWRSAPSAVGLLHPPRDHHGPLAHRHPDRWKAIGARPHIRSGSRLDRSAHARNVFVRFGLGGVLARPLRFPSRLRRWHVHRHATGAVSRLGGGQELPPRRRAPGV